MSDLPKRIWILLNDPSNELVVSATDQPYPTGSAEYLHKDKVQAQIDAAALTADNARIQAALMTERPFILGANHGYETAMEQVAEVIATMKEVIRISDRSHDAWTRAKIAISEFEQWSPAALTGKEPSHE